MWLEFRDENGVRVSRNSDAIVKFGDYSFTEHGLVATFDDGGSKTVDIFFKLEQLDELYGKMNVRQNIRLLQTGYTPKAIREKHRKDMHDFLNS